MGDKKNVPKIRFPEFTDNWEQRKVGEVITEYKETVDSDCTLPILTSSKTEGVVLQEDHFGSKQRHDITGYNILPRNYCTYRNRSDGVDFTFNVNKCCDKGIISKFYPVFTGNNSDVFFVSLVLNNSGEVIREIGYTCTGTGQKVLSFSDLKKIEIRVPSFDEQKKISVFFEQVDNLIALHQRELDHWQLLKKSLLQKMFPHDEENVPEVRFPEFTSPWEQRKFGDFGSVAMCKRIFKEQTSPDGEIPFYKIGTFGGEPDAFISRELFEEYKSKFQYPEVGDMLISASGTIGRTVEYTGKDEYFQDSNIVWFKHDKSIENSFLNCIYQTVKWAGIEGSTIKRLYNDNFLKTEFMMPSVPEQRRIGEFFQQLDNAITLHQRELNHLQLFKKALLKQMFV